jgi:hypothetical protein
MDNMQVGSINDSGILQGLRRKGFTLPKCLSELKANSIDAEANNLEYNVTSSNIKMIDDGKGMKYEEIRNMYDMHKENHAGEKKLGVSGVGGKVATMHLSEEKTVIMYTKTRNGPYWKVIVPWDIMFKEGKYSGMINVQNMNEKEIIDFHKERENMKNKDTGVTICFPYNDKLATEIEKQFVLSNDELIENQLSFIYGRFNLAVNYKHFESFEIKQMKKYDYFGGENNQYYTGKTIETIKLYEKKNVYRYIWDNKEDLFEIKKWGKGYKKVPELLTESINGWNHLGDYSVSVGCLRDEKYFTEKTNEMPQSALDVPLEYEKIHFGESKNESLCKPQLVRNDQIICSFDLPDVKISNRRANPKAMLQIRHVKCYLSYNPISNLDNKQDLLCGIQENKNQCACLLELPFSRLVQHIKHIKAEEIWTYFEKIVEHNNKPTPIPMPIVESDSSDDDSHEEEESSNEVDTNGVDTNGVNTNGVDTNEEDTNVVDTNQVVTDEVDTNEVVTNVVDTNEVDTNEVDTNEVDTNEVVTDEVVTNEVVINEVDTNEVDTNEEVTNQVVTDEVDTNQVVMDEVDTNEDEIFEDAEADIHSEEKKLRSTILELKEKLEQAEEKIKYLEKENNRLKLVSNQE